MRINKNAKPVILLLAVLLSLSIKGQNLDSLEQILPSKTSSPIEYLTICDDLSWAYLNININKSKSFARIGIKYSISTENLSMTATLYRNLGVGCYMISQMDSAILYFDKGEQFAQKANNTKILERIDLARANLYSRIGEFEKAISCYLRVLAKSENDNATGLQRQILANIGTVYFSMRYYDRSEDYHNRAIALALPDSDYQTLSQSYNGLSNIYLERKNYVKSLEFIQKSIEASKKGELLDNLSINYQGITDIYELYFHDYKKALYYANLAMDIARKDSIPGTVASGLLNISNIYYRKKDYEKSFRFALEAIKTDTADLDIYGNMAANVVRAGIHLNEKALALKYFDVYFNVNMRRAGNELQKQLAEMETKYKTEKKDLQIIALTKQKKLQMIIGLAGIVILILGLVALFFRYKSTKKERQLAHQQIIHLEQEKRLVATKSLLEGEELERARLAGDLHDGLGGLLSGIKLKLSYMKENAVITHENLVHFSHALDLLDSSISELRRVAHNLMPETLMHYGLRTALNDFIRQVVPAGKPIIGFNTFGGELRFGKELEVTVYRITQELITNAVKHGQATRIDVQLFTEPNRICVQVIDNGIGFNPEISDQSNTGKGLKSIRDRVTAFNGHFEILSHPGKGTESTVEFFVN